MERGARENIVFNQSIVIIAFCARVDCDFRKKYKKLRTSETERKGST
jgi:hypothetical protein